MFLQFQTLHSECFIKYCIYRSNYWSQYNCRLITTYQKAKKILERSWCVDKNGKTFCEVCQKIIKGGSTHVERHIQTSIHNKNLETVSCTPKIDIFFKDSNQVKLARQIKEGELKLIFNKWSSSKVNRKCLPRFNNSKKY